jgi:CubicO group peptidase (beta-lactamase class C family)|tara:strand:+ start:337 stop:1476 length:1140 start_codon:yes stop_codon:yes gene_type:complete
MDIHGYCDEKFSSLRGEFERNFTERGDVGASFAASVEGEMVVDIWGGHRNQAKTLPWDENTIVNVFSTTKTMTALCALMLIDQGKLDTEEKVSKYWPEYGQNGKEQTLVRHFMGHTAGLPGFGEQLTEAQLYDWDTVIEVLARQKPWYEPGTVCAYHAITQGYLVGELVRRITGLSLGTYFKENVASKVDADFHIGLDPSEFDRTAQIITGGPMEMPDDVEIPQFYLDNLDGTPELTEETWNGAGWRQTESPAANGHSNARAVVRAQTAVANDGVAFGVQLLTPQTIARIFEDQGVIAGVGSNHGIGYGLGVGIGGLEASGAPAGTKACFWGGAGGSSIVVDLSHRACFSYVMNQMSNDLLGDVRARTLAQHFYAGLGS